MTSSALMSFESGYGFRKLHAWAFRLNFHPENAVSGCGGILDRVSWQGGNPGKISHDCWPWSVCQAVCVGGRSRKIRKRGTYTLKVICFNLNLTYSGFNKKGLGKKRY